MKQHLVFVVLAVGLFLVAGSSGKGEASAPPKEEESEYAKIELKGQVETIMGVPEIRLRQGGSFRLDLTHGPKEFQGQGWHKLQGKTVIATGTLRFFPSKLGGMQVEVESIRVMDD